MKIFIKNHPFHYEIENITRLFFPYEKLEIEKVNFSAVYPPYIFTEIRESISVKVCFETYENSLIKAKKGNDKENEILICQLLFDILTDYSGVRMPWGMITGVRPVKYLRSAIDEYGCNGAVNYFINNYRITREKLDLALLTEKFERPIINSSKENSFSLYISIPFCPTRCSYCSFVSQSVSGTKQLIKPYLKLLCDEIEYTGKIAADNNLRLETVYVGGGTPTTLSPEQLATLVRAIKSSFDMSSCREFTVEAGRPDTITEEKLIALIDNGVTRVSINPQTLNDKVLEEIGRRHTAACALDALNLAGKCGFSVINSDLIAGLPSDALESFRNSLDSIISFGPENITVHTLSLKRSADYSGNGFTSDRDDAIRTGKMLEYAEKTLLLNGYIPYYLYRQSRMVGNFENVGWSKPSCEGLYNVFTMDETHSILACGAGGATKLKNPKTGDLIRIFNYKFPYEYIDNFQEIINRKIKVGNFFRDL